jgi:prolipoprotein diacylglyceryltransferase
MNLGDGQLRHPVALYEIVFLLYIWFCLKRTERHLPLANGYRFQLFMISYLCFRFFLDFIKPGLHYFYGLGSIQMACVFGLMYYRNTLYKIFFKPLALFQND